MRLPAEVLEEAPSDGERNCDGDGRSRDEHQEQHYKVHSLYERAWHGGSLANRDLRDQGLATRLIRVASQSIRSLGWWAIIFRSVLRGGENHDCDRATGDPDAREEAEAIDLAAAKLDRAEIIDDSSTALEITSWTADGHEAKQESDGRISQQNNGCLFIEGGGISHGASDVFARTESAGQPPTNTQGRKVHDQRADMQNRRHPIERALARRGYSPKGREMDGEAHEQPGQGKGVQKPNEDSCRRH